MFELKKMRTGCESNTKTLQVATVRLNHQPPVQLNIKSRGIHLPLITRILWFTYYSSYRYH